MGDKDSGIICVRICVYIYICMFQVLGSPLTHDHGIPPTTPQGVAWGGAWGLHMLYGECIIAGASEQVVHRCYIVVCM